MLAVVPNGKCHDGTNETKDSLDVARKTKQDCYRILFYVFKIDLLKGYNHLVSVEQQDLSQ